jgi:HTH-like domain
MIAFIDDHRGAYGVEPICRVLPIAPSTYHAHAARRADPARLSTRARRDDALKPEVQRVFEENFRVYGVRKVWRQLKREGHDVARCTAEYARAFANIIPRDAARGDIYSDAQLERLCDALAARLAKAAPEWGRDDPLVRAAFRNSGKPHGKRHPALDIDERHYPGGIGP